VIGLTTALLAQQAGFRVTVYSDQPLAATTSAKAAASFKPSAIDYDAATARLTELSWSVFARLAAESPETSGVRQHVHFEAASSSIDRPPYLNLMEDVAALQFPDVPGGYAFAWRYQTFFIDTPIFLPWLAEQVRAHGGRFVLLTKPFQSLNALAELSGEVVFNCTGLGARALCDDHSLRPVKGQVALVDPQPDMNWSIKADGFYVYPRTHDTVLGATEEWDVDDDHAEAGAIDAIVRANRRILPHLTLDQVRGVYAGRRPYRSQGVRIASELIGGKLIIHNYGHGGSGFTLCWGSARTALDLV
jgi:D-amino-acid oxidase